MFVIGYLQSNDGKNIILNVSSPKTSKFLSDLDSKRKQVDSVKYISPFKNGKLRIKINKWNIIPQDLLNQEVIAEVQYKKYAFKDKLQPTTAVVGYYLKLLSIKQHIGD